LGLKSGMGRLGNLLGWLEEAAPDIVCLQELKAPNEKFPAAALRAAGYGAVWHGQKSWNGVSILARGGEPVETRRGLPGDPDDAHSRYLEAAIGSILVGCLYRRTAIRHRGRNSTTTANEGLQHTGERHDRRRP
jgi:exodeoxyribonuclease-3